MAGVAYFKIFRDNRSEYRWQFVARNGEIIAVSSEGYVREVDCRHSIALIKREGPSAPII